MVRKADLVEEAQLLGLNVGANNTVPEPKKAIEKAKQDEKPKSEPTETAELAPGSDLLTPAQPEAPAKAGKRSAKASREAEEKAAKTELKAQPTEKKGPTPKTRPRIERHGKKYRTAAKQIDRGKKYELTEAVALAQRSSTAKFDASVELHINLGVDPRAPEQNIRGTVALPHGTGKTLRVAVFGSDNDVKTAKAAGADMAAGEEFLEQLSKGQTDFDVLIATPETMPKLGQFAKFLGPKGLMPNPKSGTVTSDVAAAVRAAKAGKVEFRIDKQSIIHAAVGKVSFKPAELTANAGALLKTVKDARPASFKGIYIKSVTVTTTMGPPVRVKL